MLNLGWSVCPTGIVGDCLRNTTWAIPLQQTTSMKTFKRYSTVAYDARNLSILSVESISSPEQVVLDSSDLSLIFSAVLTPTPNISTTDTAMINALLSEIGWALRLYQDQFPDSTQLPLDLLRGFLLVPVQFATTAWMWVNATQQYTNTTDFALPSELETTASSTQLTYRAIAKPWTVATFIVCVSVLLIWCNSLLLYLLVRGPVAPNTSSFVEVDVGSKSTFLSKHNESSDAVHGENRQEYDFSGMLRGEGLANSESKAIVEKTRDKKVRLAAVNDRADGNVLVLVAGRSSEDFRQMELLDTLHCGKTYL